VLVSAELMPQVPLDPFDKAPLRFRRTQDGLLIYSISPDGYDSFPPPVGFRLWDVSHRRQPAQAPPPQPKTEKED
jgi:hypothetical protein